MTEADEQWRNQVLAADAVPFKGLVTGFRQACTAQNPTEFGVLIAGHPVRIRIAGDSWAQMIRLAMGHLPEVDCAVTSFDLTIEAWDASETGVTPQDCESLELIDSTILLKTSEDGNYIGEERNHGTAWLDRSSAHIVSFVRSHGRLNIDERARPFHKLLSAWLMDREIQFVHAGLIEHEGEGLLFVGNGGAGKSTSSISCLMGGMGFLGDDFIALGRSEDGFVGYGLYASCLLNQHHIKRFPTLESVSRPGYHDSEEKHVVYLSDLYPDGMSSKVPIRALVLPRVVGTGPTGIRTASKPETLLAIAPTSVMFLPRPSKWAFERLADLVQETPCYWLELGEDVSDIPDVVRSIPGARS